MGTSSRCATHHAQVLLLCDQCGRGVSRATLIWNRDTHQNKIINNLSFIKNQVIETVDHFKYLGGTLDNQLTFDQLTFESVTFRKGTIKDSVIRKLKRRYFAPRLLLLLYQSMIQSIILYCFFGMLLDKNKVKLICITTIASKIIGLPKFDRIK